MTGKEKCEYLKFVRQRVADLNGVEYHPHQCNNEGECSGHCPACDEEAQYLMRQLQEKEAAGVPIIIDTTSHNIYEYLGHKAVEYDDIKRMKKKRPANEAIMGYIPANREE